MRILLNLLTEVGYEEEYVGGCSVPTRQREFRTNHPQPVVTDRSNYAETQAPFVRERVERGELKAIDVPSDEMVADWMTKALTPQMHAIACDQLGVGRMVAA